MSSSSAEIERTFNLSEDTTLPELADTAGVASVDPADEVVLDATYFDTEDLRLAAAHTTLRRRTGGHDAGWHLKVPTPDGERWEERRPLGRASKNPPKELCALADGALRGHPVHPVAHLTTNRAIHRLRDADDRVLAEVCDDRVVASLPGADPSSWREVEVELVEGTHDVLEAVGDLLFSIGARPAAISSKLRRALGDRAPATHGITGGRKLGPKSPAGDVLRAHLASLTAEIRADDIAVRQDRDDSVHQLRVAARRVRSLLASFRPLFDAERTEPIRAELAWLIGVLGAARDVEVNNGRLLAAARSEPVELHPDVVVARIEQRALAQWQERRRAVLDVLSGARYFSLLDELDGLLDEPPFTAQAKRPARDVLPRRIAKSWHRVLSRAVRAELAGEHAVIAALDDHAAALGESSDFDDEWLAGGPIPIQERAEPTTEAEDGLLEVDADESTEAALHEVRKAARRARYAADAVRSVWGADAARFAKRMKRVQDALGEARDAQLAADALHATALEAGVAGEDTFVYGRLHLLEQLRASGAVEFYPDALSAAGEKKIHRWLM